MRIILIPLIPFAILFKIFFKTIYIISGRGKIVRDQVLRDNFVKNHGVPSSEFPNHVHINGFERMIFE